jgi:hypothetical protein
MSRIANPAKQTLSSAFESAPKPLAVAQPWSRRAVTAGEPIFAPLPTGDGWACVEECCERDPNAWTATTTLFTSWKAWAEKGGVRCGDIKTFGEAMNENGFERKHTKIGNGYVGLRIGEDPPPRPDF